MIRMVTEDFEIMPNPRDTKKNKSINAKTNTNVHKNKNKNGDNDYLNIWQKQ